MSKKQLNFLQKNYIQEVNSKFSNINLEVNNKPFAKVTTKMYPLIVKQFQQEIILQKGKTK